MQYGHANQGDPFFTAGAGNNSEESGNFGSANKSPVEEEKLERDLSKVGNKAINSNGLPDNSQAESIAEEPDFDKVSLGEVASLSSTNSDQDENMSEKDLAAKAINISDKIINPESFKAKNDKISPKTLRDVEHIVNGFNRDKISPAELTDVVIRARKSYTKSIDDMGLRAA